MHKEGAIRLHLRRFAKRLKIDFPAISMAFDTPSFFKLERGQVYILRI
jgi:hypothetical protein